ncbi:MAG: response regulator [Victivallales bacterium]|nr:response regulator [Victivallales bacterium]
MKTNNKILVVDDQKDLREQLANLLRKAGNKDEGHSLVEQMRARLLGTKTREEREADEKESEADLPSYVVEMAGQGEDAFNMVKEANDAGDPFAVMFLDMRMPPGWDGLDTAIKIREIDKSIEIVIMTAYADHDQAQIAEKVGMPEKLLYIKKPFQAEEIYQLALSLTSKYTLEKTEKERKVWLEALLRGMSRLKSSNLDDDGIFKTVLNAIINFTQAKSGFVAELTESDGKWINLTTVESDEADSLKYLEEHSSALKESRTTQNVKGKYILPLRKEKFFGVAVIDNVSTSTDPEWYKLLSLLVMTCSEILNNYRLVRQHIDGAGTDTAKKSLQEIRELAQGLGKDSSRIEEVASKITAVVDDALQKL